MLNPYEADLYIGTAKIGRITAWTGGMPDMTTGIATMTCAGTFARYWVSAVARASAGAGTDGQPSTPVPPARIIPVRAGAPIREGELRELTLDRAVVAIRLRQGTD